MQHPLQEDGDSDGLGDACDTCPADPDNDVDTDGICGDVDNCPSAANPLQEDDDGEGAGDACDTCSADPDNDIDTDGICGDVDNCPNTGNPLQEDTDGDGIGDACDSCVGTGTDDDGDGVCSSSDNCPLVANPAQTDGDGDGLGDVCDVCPGVSDPGQADTDGDGFGDVCDNCPGDPNPSQTNADGDALGDACDVCPADPDDDADGDGLCGDIDNCPTVFNPTQVDSDGNGIGDDCEGISQTVDIALVEQDMRSFPGTTAQHNQQASSRIGTASGTKYRSLGWADLAVVPPGVVIDQVTFIYHTTSGDPGNVDNNGDSASSGGPITAELHEVLKAWNFGEPLTVADDTTDNETPASNGDTAWRYSVFSTEWEVGGAGGATDSGSTLATAMVTSTINGRTEFNSAALIALVQGWLDVPASNNGILIKASDADESSATANRKILCGKGFPLETSTNLSRAAAESQRPTLRIIYHMP